MCTTVAWRPHGRTSIVRSAHGAWSSSVGPIDPAVPRDEVQPPAAGDRQGQVVAVLPGVAVRSVVGDPLQPPQRGGGRRDLRSVRECLSERLTTITIGHRPNGRSRPACRCGAARRTRGPGTRAAARPGTHQCDGARPETVRYPAVNAARRRGPRPWWRRRARPAPTPNGYPHWMTGNRCRRDRTGRHPARRRSPAPLHRCTCAVEASAARADRIEPRKCSAPAQPACRAAQRRPPMWTRLLR